MSGATNAEGDRRSSGHFGLMPHHLRRHPTTCGEGDPGPTAAKRRAVVPRGATSVGARERGLSCRELPGGECSSAGTRHPHHGSGTSAAGPTPREAARDSAQRRGRRTVPGIRGSDLDHRRRRVPGTHLREGRPLHRRPPRRCVQARRQGPPADPQRRQVDRREGRRVPPQRPRVRDRGAAGQDSGGGPTTDGRPHARSEEGAGAVRAPDVPEADVNPASPRRWGRTAAVVPRGSRPCGGRCRRWAMGRAARARPGSGGGPGPGVPGRLR